MDLRHIAVCSIDPPGCTDIDDAVHWTKMENGNYQVRTKSETQKESMGTLTITPCLWMCVT